MASFYGIPLSSLFLLFLFFSSSLPLPLVRYGWSSFFEPICCAAIKRRIQSYREGSVASTLVARDESWNMIATVNTFRRSSGRKPLTVSRTLLIACKAHVRDMASRNFMAHVGSDGSTPAIRAMRAGYNWRAIAENVAAGQMNWRSVLTAWFKSPGHRANLLSTATTEFAAAHCEATNGKIFWAQCFGRSF